MGLDASNARLQTLVARLSDIHFRGQQINNQRLLIAANEEQLSEAYSDALSQTQIVLNTANGAQELNDTWATQLSTLSANASIVEWNAKTQAYQAVPTDQSWSTVQQGLQNGSYQLQMVVPTLDANGQTIDNPTTGAQESTTSIVNWQSDTSSCLQSATDTDGQEEAEMKYDAQLGVLQPQDKSLEMNLKDLDTQGQAVQTEIDAVKKVLDKDIELSFKTFGNG